MYKIIQLV